MMKRYLTFALVLGSIAGSAHAGDGWGFTRHHLAAIADSTEVADAVSPNVIYSVVRTGDKTDPKNASYRLKVGRADLNQGPFCFAAQVSGTSHGATVTSVEKLATCPHGAN
jgi:hypothetical protein